MGPSKKKSSNEVVEDLFKGAKEHGAVPLDRSGRGLGEPSKAKVKYSYCEQLSMTGSFSSMLLLLADFFCVCKSVTLF